MVDEKKAVTETGNPVVLSELMATYRTLIASKKSLEGMIDEVRAGIYKQVELGGDFTDEHGYAKFQQRSSYATYPGPAVENLAQTWARSKDPIMQSCGQMLIQLREVREATKSLMIK